MTQEKLPHRKELCLQSEGSPSRDEPFDFYTIYENLYVFTGSHNGW